MQLLTKIASVFLLSVLLVCTAYYIPFSIQQNQIRKEIKNNIKAGIDKKDLSQFTFSAEKLKQVTVNEKGEIKVGDNLYDIVKKEIKNDKIIVFALIDKKEKELFKDLSELVNSYMGNEKNGPSPLKALGKINSLKYLPNTLILNNQIAFTLLENKFFNKNFQKINDGFSGNPFTPPKFVA